MRYELHASDGEVVATSDSKDTLLSDNLSKLKIGEEYTVYKVQIEIDCKVSLTLQTSPVNTYTSEVEEKKQEKKPRGRRQEVNTEQSSTSSENLKPEQPKKEPEEKKPVPTPSVSSKTTVKPTGTPADLLLQNLSEVERGTLPESSQDDDDETELVDNLEFPDLNAEPTIEPGLAVFDSSEIVIDQEDDDIVPFDDDLDTSKEV
jgi:hypothetical protein